LENDRTGEALAHRQSAPKLCEVIAILMALEESFCQHLHQGLLEADCEDIRVAESPAEFPPLLFDCKDAVVILGGRWPDLQPPLRMVVRATAPAILVLQQLASTSVKERGQRAALRIGDRAALDEGAREALEMGARAVLHADVSKTALKAAIVAAHAGLIVLDSTLQARQVSLKPDDAPHELSRHTGRQLTIRERKILSLVAGGVSNKGIARSLGVSVNTVKFHLASAFEKLNAATRAEAVAEGIRRGELSV
jgi:DNA-binding NarL/FixJ family response regulator